jgi:DNA-directed RNA polymerase sigma subunit (sigma70/sigma32)
MMPMTQEECLALLEIEQLMEDAGRSLTYREIGQRLGMSHESVRTMERIAIMKLKKRIPTGWAR